jgi:phosphonate transport system ATP-binding protein
VELRGVARSFGGREVFRGVTMRVNPGEAMALVGANGTGKSTLLRICLGLIRPDSGEVRLFGSPLDGSLRARRARVGLVAQKHNLSPRLSVLSNVLHGLLGSHTGPRYWWQALAPGWARARAMAALGSVGLGDLALRRADRLSGGQSQRVAIARALVNRPRLLVADEPAASLDPAAGEEVMRLFFRLMREHGVTVIFTSHHIEHALGFADRVIGLRDGRLTLDARAADLTARDLRGLYD